MTKRMAEPAGGGSPRYNRPRSKSIVSPPSSLATQEEATIPPVQRHSEMTQIPGMRQSTSAIQGHGVDEPEALKEALRRSRMSSRVDPADPEEEKEEIDVQESKMPDDDLQSYEEMREGAERSDMGVEDVQLPMPAVRQEYGQRATLRIAGARGAFDKHFRSYDRVPMESKYPALAGTKEFIRKTPYGPFAPVKKSILDSLPDKRTDIDFSKHRLEKRATATLALLETTQPRQRARTAPPITTEQRRGAQDIMGAYRRAERMTRETFDMGNERRVERYNTQPAITVSAEPVVSAEPDVPPSPELPGVGGDDL